MKSKSWMNKISIPFLLGCLTALILSLIFANLEIENKIRSNSSNITSNLNLSTENQKLSDFPTTPKMNLESGINSNDADSEEGIKSPANDDYKVELKNQNDLGLIDNNLPNAGNLNLGEGTNLEKSTEDDNINSQAKSNHEVNLNSSLPTSKQEEFLEYEGIVTPPNPQQSTEKNSSAELNNHFNSANQNINDFYFFDQQFLPKDYNPTEKELLKKLIAEKTKHLNNNYQSYLQQTTGREKTNFQRDQKNWEERLGLDAKFLKESYSEDLVLKNYFDKINGRNVLLTSIKETPALSSKLEGVYSDGSGGILLIESATTSSFKFSIKVLRSARYANASEISGEAKIENDLGLFIKNHSKASNPKQIETAKIFFKIADREIKISYFNTDYLFPLGVSFDGNYRKIFETAGDYYLTTIKQDQTQSDNQFINSLNGIRIVSDSKTQYQIGHNYLNGKGLVRDYQKAFFWLQKAAANNFPLADFDLYLIYLYGLGQTKNEVSAVIHLDRSRSANLPEALLHSGVARLKGEIYPQDNLRAIAELNKSKDLGNAEANLMLALIYLNGVGVSQDIPKALSLLEIAINKNVSESFSILGEVYLGDKYVKKDLNKSYKFFQRGYQAGNPNSSLNYALLLRESVNLSTQEEGLRILKSLADSDHPGAQFHYAKYLIMKLGKNDSLSVPLSYLKKSADQGHINSYYLLGVFYESSRLENNYPKAIQYYNKAILANHPGAYYRLSELYREGKGVPLDRQRADWLLQKSIDFGSNENKVIDN